MQDPVRFEYVCKAITLKIGEAEWDEKDIVRELREFIGTRQNWMKAISKSMIAEFAKRPNDRLVFHFVTGFAPLQRCFVRSKRLREIAGNIPTPSQHRSVGIASQLAITLANGTWSRDSIAIELENLIGKNEPWMATVAADLVDQLGEARPNSRAIFQTLLENEHLQAAKGLPFIDSSEVATFARTMQPAKGNPETWQVPELLTPADLAEWLTIPLPRLAWLTDLRAAFRVDDSQWHYRCHWLKKHSGGSRLVEAPKLRLKQVQRTIAHDILNEIPPHSAAHGFRRGHNIRSFVASHTQKSFVLRMDLQDFFPSIHRARVAAIFRTAGYPETVTKMLSALTTTVTPPAILQSDGSSPDQSIWKSPHLPQGAPTSPALANLVAYRLDCRLHGLARQFDADYTRYADDLLFSGGDTLAKRSKRFHVFALSIVLEEGFRIQPRKTRMMRPGSRQTAAGLVLNAFPNAPRRDYEQLKAILHNCKTQSVDSQNRNSHPSFQQHLLGRIQFHAQMNSNRGEKLMRAFRDVFQDA